MARIIAMSSGQAMHCSLQNTAVIATTEAGVSPSFLNPPIPILQFYHAYDTPPEEVLSHADQTSYAVLDSSSLALCSEVGVSSILACLLPTHSFPA